MRMGSESRAFAWHKTHVRVVRVVISVHGELNEALLEDALLLEDAIAPFGQVQTAQ